MPLRQSQIKEVLDLYADGLPAGAIAEKLRVSTSDVKPFIPTGDLLIAYQKVHKNVDKEDTIEDVMAIDVATNTTWPVWTPPI